LWLLLTATCEVGGRRLSVEGRLYLSCKSP